ncbi:MAG: hypothetical protein NDJ92_07785 [Thermoanaerobaculia bacterium]|nr:hypothetical protein [Thermoanaerobaculia bacterium]
MRNIFVAAALASALSCVSVPAPQPVAVSRPDDPPITAAAFSRDRSTLWFAVGRGRCDVRALAIEAKTERVAFSLDSCPGSIIVLEDESLLLTDGTRFGAWRRPDGSEVMPASEVVAAADASNYVIARDGRLVWKRGALETEVGSRESVRELRLLRVTGDLLAITHRAEGELIVRMTAAGANDVSPVFTAIDSFDVAPRGDEIVFSARRESGFDVAIASLDGTKLNWVAPDPADEVVVTWAPRGNKISYLLRGLDSTVVRTVHVPTAFQLTFDTPYMAVRGIAWEPRAERFAMILDGPTASPHIDWIEYGGSRRETLVAARNLVVREPEPIAFGSSKALLLPPPAIRYGETLPLFVRLTDEPLSWSPDLQDLASLGGGILVVPAGAWGDGKTLADVLGALTWVDPGRIVVIDPPARLAAGTSGFTTGRTLLTLGTKQAPGRVFSLRELPEGGSAVEAADWQGAMVYLRGEFKTKR